MKEKLLDITNNDGTLKLGGLIKELIKMRKDIDLLSEEMAILEDLVFNKPKGAKNENNK